VEKHKAAQMHAWGRDSWDHKKDNFNQKSVIKNKIKALHLSTTYNIRNQDGYSNIE
jgi:hypothetical protein